MALPTVKQQIINGLTWFKSFLEENVIDNLVSSNSGLPLSANMGKKLKGLIDDLGNSITTKKITAKGDYGENVIIDGDEGQISATSTIYAKLGFSTDVDVYSGETSLNTVNANVEYLLPDSYVTSSWVTASVSTAINTVVTSEIPLSRADKYYIYVTSVQDLEGWSTDTFTFTINKHLTGFSLSITNADAAYWFGTLKNTYNVFQINWSATKI